ncbi:MAG: hypothetical protein AB8H86_26225 [Polyangiales bacterium]
MSAPSTASQQDEAAAEADVVAFLQFLLFLCGTSVGSFNTGWTWPVAIAIGAGLIFPAARTWAERRVRRHVPVGEGTPTVQTRARLAGVVVLSAALYGYYRPSELCGTLVVAPIVGLVADNLLSSWTLGFGLLQSARRVRGWTQVEVLSVDDCVATIQRDGDLVLARADGPLPLGIVYVDMDHHPLDYRHGAASHIRNFESLQTRRRRRSLRQLAAIRLCTGLMWVAVVLSPFVGETLGRR